MYICEKRIYISSRNLVLFDGKSSSGLGAETGRGRIYYEKRILTGPPLFLNSPPVWQFLTKKANIHQKGHFRNNL